MAHPCRGTAAAGGLRYCRDCNDIRMNLKMTRDFETFSMEVSSLQTTSREEQSTRNYRIFTDYGTDFIWLKNDADESNYIEAADAQSNLPKEVFENYSAWVEAYTVSFKERCEDPGDYSAHVFLTATKEVSWSVAGYFLAWRIAMAPQVGSVEFAVGDGKYLLRKGKDVENDVTYSFLEDQAMLLARGESTE
jgi:hypothetical protein